MKRTKKLVSGLLVLMMLAGLGVMPVGATVDTTEYVVNGNFEDTTGMTFNESGEVNTDGITSMPGWTFPESVLANGKTVLVKPGNADYKGYGAELTEGHGNYITIVQTGSQVVPITQAINLETETVYTVTMQVFGYHDGIRYDVEYMGITNEEKATYNPAISFENNTGTDYYIWNSSNTGWRKVTFNLTLPTGATGIRLSLRTTSAEKPTSYDDISIKKATNMISAGDFRFPDSGTVSARYDVTHANARPYCGAEYWFATGADNAIKTPVFSSGYGYVKGGDTAMNQFVPVKDGTLYKLRINGWGDMVGRTLKMKMTFPEDTSYTIEKEFTVTASSNCVREAYIYIDGNFAYNSIPQSLTEAKMTLYGDATDANPELTGTPTFWLKGISLTEVAPITADANISALEAGENTVTVNATIFKKAWGGTDKATLFVGVYEENKLTDIKAVQLDCGENDSATQTISDIKATKGEGVQVKAFLWDANGGMKPLELVTIR